MREFNEHVQLLNIAQLMNIKQYYYLEADEEVDVNSTAQVITGDYRVLQLHVITTIGIVRVVNFWRPEGAEHLDLK